MEKSFSQRVARFLEIINYFVLIPTSLIEIFTILFGFNFLVTGESGALFFCVVITAIYAFGALLLYGYFKHSRGETSENTSFWLWVGTIVFNSVPVVLMLWILANDRNFTNEGEFWFYNILGSYLSVILLAALALISDLRHKFN
jgi:hypothetical protein